MAVYPAAFPLSPQASFVPATTIYPAGSLVPSPAYSGTVIPEIWSGKLLEKFYQSTVLAAISNTAYEGEIKNQGDKVHIRTKPAITINDYSSDAAIVVERPSSNIIDLVINKGKYFATILDDVMEVQADINLLGIWSDDAAQQMKIKIDRDVLTGLLVQADASNRGITAGKETGTIVLGVTGTPIAASAITGTPASSVSVLDIILRMGQCLDEQNVPEEGRWVVLPTWAATMIKRSELRQAYLSGDSVSMLRNGRLGQIDRFTLYVSNLMPKGPLTAGVGGVPTGGTLASGEWVFYAGHAHGLTFASQVSKVETLRSEHTFGQIMRGLQVYGYKVVDPVALVQAVVTPAVGG